MPGITYFRFPFVKYEHETQDFTLVEHGIFLKLIMHYFTIGGPLPNDMERLKRISGVRTHKEAKSLEFVMNKFFVLSENKFFNLFGDSELTHIREISAINSANRSNGRTNDRSNDRPTADFGGSNGQYIPVAIRRQQRNHAIIEAGWGAGMDVNFGDTSGGQEDRPTCERQPVVEGQIKRLQH